MRLSYLDLKALQVFKTAVENHGFRGAQITLGVSPSVISTQIKMLEDRLGFQLCQRGKGGFRLSEKGLGVYNAFKTLGGAISAFELYTGELRNTLSGTFRIGLSANTVTDKNLRVFDVIRLFNEHKNDVYFDITVQTTEALEQGLGNGELHLAIAPFINRLDDLSYTKLYLERHFMYVGSRHHLFARADSEITLEDITKERIVTRGYMKQGDLIAIKGSQSAASVSSMEAQLVLILSGYYIGYLADHYAAEWVRRGEIRRFAHEELEFSLPFYSASPRRQAHSLVLDSFQKCLKTLCDG
jgi:DNA-binding transcriptional LysR family regulator